MRRTFLSLVLTAAAASVAFAQEARQTTRANADVESTVQARKAGKDLNIASGTRLAAQLENTLDVRNARVGDRVVLKTTEAIKSNGKTVVKKGARLVGHVAQVQERVKGSAESSVTLLFDRLESGSLTTPITATINSVTQARARGRVDDEGFEADASARSNTSAGGQSKSSGGGLLGGATNAVGGVVGTTTQVTSDVVGGVADTAGGTVSSVGRTVGQIRITQSASASAGGSSTLSLTGGNLRLEKGTTFQLSLSQSASVNNDQR